MDQLRKERSGLLLVDTGDLLYSNAGIRAPNARKIGEIRGDFFMKAYNRMGYDAFTPGELDLAFGVEDLLRLRRRANFPFLLANLLHASSSERVFTPYLIKETEGLKVGLIGLLSNRLALGGPPEEKGRYRLADPLETAKKYVGELKKQNCRLIVVAAHMDLADQEKLAQAVPGIHFILGGHYAHYHLDSHPVNGTKIFLAGSRGENIGHVVFSPEQADPNARYRLVPLNPQVPDHPQIQEMLQQYKTDLQGLVQKPPQPAPRLSPRTSRRHVVVPVTPAYAGEKSCEPCHPDQHRQWKASAHARAFQTLVAKDKAQDFLCLACHTTGYGTASLPGGYMKDVQCEACHGAGEGHPELGRSFPKVGEAVCLKCHNSANSPHFNYPAYLQKVLHPK